MRYLFCIITCLACLSLAGQSKLVKEIDNATPPAAALSPLRFLASDELMGRGTLRPEIHTAARYISEQFRSAGLKELTQAPDYFQKFEIKLFQPTANGTFSVNTAMYEIGKNLVQIRGTDLSAEAGIVYIGYGKKSDWEKTGTQQKIVVVDAIGDSSVSVMQEIRSIDARQQLAQDHGALALVVRFKDGDVSWNQIQRRFQRESIWNDPRATTPVFLINEQGTDVRSVVNSESKASIKVTGNKLSVVQARNVMGFIGGSDAKLKDQFVVLSAHYDHLGVATKAKMEEGKMDSIYNGARDNAIGVAAVINAARYFALHPPKRSILFVAYTAEEMGMGGSKYFAENPTVPLKQMVYNLNIDNGGYNDTTRISVVGFGRTSADADFTKAASAYGLSAMADPAPEQNLFDRSDNVSLAVKGIPAPSFSMGFKSFDEAIMKRYHQLSDEVADMSPTYCVKYIRCFILSAKHIADNPMQPNWKAGDKYEAAWKTLYGK